MLPQQDNGCSKMEQSGSGSSLA